MFVQAAATNGASTVVVGAVSAVAAIVMALLVNAVLVARWSARIETLVVEKLAPEVAGLREAKHDHANQLHQHGARLAVLEDRRSQ